MATFSYLCFFVFHFVISVASSSDGVQLILANNCGESIWPGILATNGHETPYQGGLHLCSGEQILLQLPKSWSGRIWPRQGCRFDEAAAGNKISPIPAACQTGDCNGVLHCNGSGGALPTTLLEMTFGTQTLHYYDVSLVDGFNIPVSMRPVGGDAGGDGRTQCGVAACEADLNVCCPEKLAVKRGGKVAGCKSACLAARKDRYCCTGEFANPERCKPTIFSHLFKAICPRAYSYAYDDDENALRTCKAPRYVITFCPPKME